MEAVQPPHERMLTLWPAVYELVNLTLLFGGVASLVSCLHLRFQIPKSANAKPDQNSNSNYSVPYGKFRKFPQAEQRAEGAFLTKT